MGVCIKNEIKMMNHLNNKPFNFTLFNLSAVRQAFKLSTQ